MVAFTKRVLVVGVKPDGSVISLPMTADGRLDTAAVLNAQTVNVGSDTTDRDARLLGRVKVLWGDGTVQDIATHADLLSVATKLDTVNGHLVTIEGWVDGIEARLDDVKVKLDTLHADVDTVEPKLQTLIDNDAVLLGNRTYRMMNKIPLAGKNLWFDTADASFIYIAEALSTANPATDTVWDGIRITKDANGNPLGEVQQSTASFKWNDRAIATWV